MGYSAIASTLRTKCSDLEALVSDADSISFDAVWSGSAHDSMVTSLDDLISRTNAEIANIRTFADALDSLQKYKEHRENLEKMLQKEQEFCNKLAEKIQKELNLN